jgi:hypothetical protein
VRAALGGIVGTAGISLATSVDGGVTFGAPVALSTNHVFLVPGVGSVRLNLGEGTIATGDTFAFTTTAPTPESELTTLFAVIRDELSVEYPGVSVVFGPREAPKQLNQGTGRANRVVFTPGDPSGDAGEEVAPRYPGSDPRPLKDELEKFTVFVWGYDHTNAQDGARQHDAAWSLFCAWRRAVFLNAEGRVSILNKAWVSPDRVQLPFGMELRIVCEIRSQVLDQVLGVSDYVEASGAVAELTAEDLDATQTATTSGE